MRSEVLSNVNASTETHADLFTTLLNDTDTRSLTSSAELSSISNTLNKVEEINNVSHNKYDLFNLVIQLQNDKKI